MKVFYVTLIISIIGATIIKIAESLFGVVNVFMFAFIVTAFMGIVYVPYKQLTKKSERI